MKYLLPITFAAAMLTGCGGDGSNNNTVSMPPPSAPPVEPPVVNPPPVSPPQMQSFAAFTRQVIADDENATPREVNEVPFNFDAAEDNFEDLLQ